MTDKKSFILYLDQQDLFNKLPDEIAGKLIKHIFSYVNCENPVTDDLIIDIAFESIRQALKRDLKSWETSLKQRSEAGKRSAEVRAIKKQRGATKSTTVKSRSTNPTVSVNGSVSVSDKDKDSDILFCEFWESYPRKTDKKKSKVSYFRLSTIDQLSANIDCKTRFIGIEKQFIPHATTYLNGERFKDEVIHREENTGNSKRNLTAVERVEAAGKTRLLEVENNRKDDLPALESYD